VEEKDLIKNSKQTMSSVRIKELYPMVYIALHFYGFTLTGDSARLWDKVSLSSANIVE